MFSSILPFMKTSPLRPWLLAAPALLLALASCQSGNKPGAGQPDLIQANLDTTVRPGDDFFMYANGTWLKKHPIPASESSWGIGKVLRRLRSSPLLPKRERC